MSVSKEAFYYGENNIWTTQRYIHHAGRRLPKILLSEEEHSLGVWGQRRLRYLKQHHKILYYNLLTSGKLHSHFADVDEEAQSLFFRPLKQYFEHEGVTEQLKAKESNGMDKEDELHS